MSEFRAFGEWFHCTWHTEIDGVDVYTLKCALALAAFTPIPVYLLHAAEPWGVVDLREIEPSPRFDCTGTFSRPWPVAHPALGAPRLAADPIGTHIPEAAKAEIVAWCEAFVRAQPDRPLIPRLEVAAPHRGIQIAHTILFSYNRLAQDYDLSRHEHDPGLRPARLAQGSGPHAADRYGAGLGDAGARASRTHRSSRRTSPARGQTLAPSGYAREHTLFDENGSDDRD